MSPPAIMPMTPPAGSIIRSPGHPRLKWSIEAQHLTSNVDVVATTRQFKLRFGRKKSIQVSFAAGGECYVQLLGRNLAMLITEPSMHLCFVGGGLLFSTPEWPEGSSLPSMRDLRTRGRDSESRKSGIRRRRANADHDEDAEHHDDMMSVDDLAGSLGCRAGCRHAIAVGRGSIGFYVDHQIQCHLFIVSESSFRIRRRRCPPATKNSDAAPPANEAQPHFEPTPSNAADLDAC